jgi:DNA-directed RNA polymerase subunit F
MDPIYYVISISLTIIGMLAGVTYWLGRKFSRIDHRFEKIEGEISRLRGDISRAFDGMKPAIVTINSLMLDFLSLKGLIRDDEARMIGSEMQRVFSIVKLNPLAKEDLEYLRKIFSKDVDEITIEEAEKVAEIGKKWWYEDGSEIAYKTFLAGLVIRGYHISKMVKEGKKPWLEPPFRGKE